MGSSSYELKNVEETRDDPQSDGPQVFVVGGRHGKGSNNQQQQQQELDITQQKDQLMDSMNTPNDKYNLVFIIFLIHGVGTLMPWNMFCTADDYFRQYKLKPGEGASEEVISHLDSIRTNFFSYLGIASQIPNLLFSGMNLIVDLGSGNLKVRVNCALIVQLMVFITTIILASVDSSQWPVIFFHVTMLSVVILNTSSGIYQNCMFGTTAKFPSRYTNALLIGSNLSGTYTSIINIVSRAIAPEPQIAAIYYFVTALIVLVACILSYNLLPINRFFNYFDKKGQESDTSDTLQIETIQESNDVPGNLREAVDAMSPRPVKSLTFTEKLNQKVEVFKKCRMQLFNVFLTFFVTLALFPAILANIRSEQHYLSDVYFSPVYCFLGFNASALLGNVISYYTSWPGKDRVWILTVARLLFLPFFILLCNYQPVRGKTRTLGVLLPYDNFYLVGNILMAVSSGYLSSICMMFVSSGLKGHEALTAGMLGGFFLIFGIFTGVMSTFLTTWVMSLGIK